VADVEDSADGDEDRERLLGGRVDPHIAVVEKLVGFIGVVQPESQYGMREGA